jgi:hypothetical protein
VKWRDQGDRVLRAVPHKAVQEMRHAREVHSTVCRHFFRLWILCAVDAIQGEAV